MHKKINNCVISDFLTTNVWTLFNKHSFEGKNPTRLCYFFFHAVLDCKLWICHYAVLDCKLWICHLARCREALLQMWTVLVPTRVVLRRKLELVFDPEITTCVRSKNMAKVYTKTWFWMHALIFDWPDLEQTLKIYMQYSMYFACNNDLYMCSAVLTNLLGDVHVFLSFLPHLSLEDGLWEE